MKYRNGREAKNGDLVVWFPSVGFPTLGVLYGTKEGLDWGAGKIAAVHRSDPTPCLEECLHYSDVNKAVFEKVSL
jgi:hypothetical protein